MEENLSLSYEEATALLEMCLFTYLDRESEAGENALRKLGEVCRLLATDHQRVNGSSISKELPCVCGC